MDILINLLIAAEAAYEYNPTPRLEKWIDLLERKVSQMLANEAEKPQK